MWIPGGNLPFKHDLGLWCSSHLIGDEPSKISSLFESFVVDGHRSLNKMMMLLACGMVVAGVLVIPSRDMYQYLTDRIGNIAELEPYLDHWRNNFRCDQGYLEIIVIEHDGTSLDVMRIPKGTDGRAAR